MNDEQKIIINTQGGPVITGGNFVNTEFVANKYVMNEPPKTTIPMAVETEECHPNNDKNPSKEKILLSCIETLMDEKDEEGSYLVNKGNHWIAVFRIIVDKNLGTSNTDYKGFCDMIEELMPKEGFRVALRYDNLKRISASNFTKPFDKWEYDPAYNHTRKPYEEMVKIAARFKEILEESGF